MSAETRCTVGVGAVSNLSYRAGFLSGLSATSAMRRGYCRLSFPGLLSGPTATCLMDNCFQI